MADTDSVAGSQGQKTSTSPHTAGDTALPGEQKPQLAEGVVTLFDIIEACLEELPALREVMPSRHTRAYLMSDRLLESFSSSPDQSIDLLGKLDNFDHTKHAVLIIEDIDAVWFHALAAPYAESLDVKFLAQHVLRLGELRATYKTHYGLGDGYRALVARVDAELSRRITHTTTVPRHCCHIDGHVDRSTIHGFGNILQKKESVVVGNGYRTEERIV